MSKAPTFGEAVLQIAPADIFIPQRLGLFFPDKAAALGELMAVHGQRTPGTVRKPLTKEEKASGKPWVLIAGRHRLSGAELKGLDFVALERIGVSLEEALDEEASENLDRRDQPPLERAIFIEATCRAAQERVAARSGGVTQQRAAIAARWSRVKAGDIRAEKALQDEVNDTVCQLGTAYGWMDSVIAAFGRGKSDIHRAKKLYRGIIAPFPELVQALSDHPVVGNNQKQLLDIAGINREDLRRQVIELLLADPELSADDARVQVGIGKAEGREATTFEKFTNQITGALMHLSAADQKRGLSTIVKGLKTDEVKRQLRDLLIKELGYD